MAVIQSFKSLFIYYCLWYEYKVFRILRQKFFVHAILSIFSTISKWRHNGMSSIMLMKCIDCAAQIYILIPTTTSTRDFWIDKNALPSFECGYTVGKCIWVKLQSTAVETLVITANFRVIIIFNKNRTPNKVKCKNSSTNEVESAAEIGGCPKRQFVDARCKAQ